MQKGIHGRVTKLLNTLRFDLGITTAVAIAMSVYRVERNPRGTFKCVLKLHVFCRFWWRMISLPMCLAHHYISQLCDYRKQMSISSLTIFSISRFSHWIQKNTKMHRFSNAVVQVVSPGPYSEDLNISSYLHWQYFLGYYCIITTTPENTETTFWFISLCPFPPRSQIFYAYHCQIDLPNV